MRTRFTELVGVEHPIVAFNRSPAVVVEASRAGALGVLGGTAYGPDELDAQLTWIEERLAGAPYGVNLVIATQHVEFARDDLVASLRAQLPPEHLEFVAGLIEKYQIPPLPPGVDVSDDANVNFTPGLVPALLEVCYAHRIGFIASALGTPSPEMLSVAKANGVPVGALVGRREHAERQLASGVDVLIAQGTEAGGHTGEIATMVLTPEIVELAGDVPVLAAGGIASGPQLAAALALGAAGAWCGSVWLSTVEDVARACVREKFLGATSSDTVRSRTRSGKPMRQLTSAWLREWSAPGAPDPLPIPLQRMLVSQAWEQIYRAADDGHGEARELVSFPVGQVVGSFRELRRTGEVVAEMAAAAQRRIRDLGTLL